MFLSRKEKGKNAPRFSGVEAPANIKSGHITNKTSNYIVRFAPLLRLGEVQLGLTS
jgi:hypothetical protein